MTWIRVAFDHALTHAVPRSLAQPLMLEMIERGHPLTNFAEKYGPDHAAALGDNPKVIDDWAIDFGGGVFVGMPKETFVVAGLVLDIWCDHMDDARRALSESTVRMFDDGQQYHKLRHWHHATVLTVEQHAFLAREVESRLTEANRRAGEFMAAVKRGRLAGVS